MKIHFYLNAIFLFLTISPQLNAENIDPKSIHCIEVTGIKNLYFDAGEERRYRSRDLFSTPYVIHDSVGLSNVCQKINELLEIRGIRLSPYLESETFHIGGTLGIPMVSYGQMPPAASLIFYFNDGRLPQLLVLNSRVNFNSHIFSCDEQWSDEMFSTLRTLSKKEYDRTIIEQAINSEIDYDAIEWTYISLISLSDTKKYSRDEALYTLTTEIRKSRGKTGFFTSKEKIKLMFNCLQSLKYNTTLYYSVDETGYVAHFGNRGNLDWKDTSKHVIGYIVIKRTDASFPYELIWINADFSIDRDYFEFNPSDEIIDFIMKIYNSDIKFDPKPIRTPFCTPQ